MEKKRFCVLAGVVPYAGKNYSQGMVIESDRDLENEPRYLNRVRLMDGKVMLPPINKRQPVVTSEKKLSVLRRSTKKSVVLEELPQSETPKEGD